KAVDKLIIVVEPGRRSIETAVSIKGLASEIGLENLAVVGNKVRNESDMDFIKSNLLGFEFLGFIPYDQAVIEADHANLSPLESSEEVRASVTEIYNKLIAGAKNISLKG
ncbi:MAG: hypothetical protein JSU58_06765, partial [Dehalococcoidales bacterium]